ncbi:ABC transporter permease subunit [Rhizobium wuzhouense]|nr:ABC transporter permease subunit [Rhizobium wuzhouense]
MPMIVVLLSIAMLIVPMAIPASAHADKLLRTQTGMALFTSAYLAEVKRAGLQALPGGQTDAASALGMTYWQTARLIVLPQALRAVIGVHDLLNSAKAFATDTL